MFWKPSESGTFSIARGTFPSTLPISSTGYTNGCSSLMVDTLVLLQFLTEPKFNKKISQLTTIESWAQTLVLFRTLCPCTLRIFSFHISNAYRRLQFYIWMHPIQMRPKRQRLCSTDEKKKHSCNRRHILYWELFRMICFYWHCRRAKYREFKPCRRTDVMVLHKF